MELFLRVDSQSLSRLQELDLSNNQLTHLHGVGVLGDSLLSLRVDHNALRHIEGLDACFALRLLSVSHNQLKSVRNLGHMRQLEQLNLAFNAIPTLDALRPLSGLVEFCSFPLVCDDCVVP